MNELEPARASKNAIAPFRLPATRNVAVDLKRKDSAPGEHEIPRVPAVKNMIYINELEWRPRPELNWCTRFCRPLRNHSATWPQTRLIKHLADIPERTDHETGTRLAPNAKPR